MHIIWADIGETALKLSKFFGLSEKFWINLQTDYDLRIIKHKLYKDLDKIHTLPIQWFKVFFFDDFSGVNWPHIIHNMFLLFKILYHI